ncbi:hypothetical protein [Azotobacter beijerinckii]|uniref:Uncharacterized protein n=1 Tax=Azotobacter beijerinckii TaxID=170623 RepID=A0A1I4INK2_9GAMM|nr:hypothetical protein [Azotobacter beijerinckii]SFL55989.1 hypothetical protein SAMN04244574_04652 [Azotobacter beijerinckii]
MRRAGIWLFISALLLAASWTVWQRVPHLAIAEWDAAGDGWRIVAYDWAGLPYLWPLALACILGGFFLFGIAFAWGYDWARNADHREQIAQLSHERDRALAEAEARIAWREQAAQQAQERAEQIRLAALQAEQHAHAKVQAAAAEVERYRLRARNAICAAARIKHKTVSVP